MTLQETLSAGMKRSYSGSIIKKMNKDNFLDIHIPSVNTAKSTHLFFNTPQSGIKIGFYCRDEEFVKATLKKSKKLESYSQGIRLKGNPVFENADLAIMAAIDFIDLMTVEKNKKEVKPIALNKPKPAVKKAPKITSKPEIVKLQIQIPPKVEIQESEPIGFWQWLLRIFK
ncbi:hypothetical protein ACST14_06345 [Aquirufa sp. A-Brett2-15D]